MLTIFRVWSLPKDIEYQFDVDSPNTKLHLNFGGRYFGKEVTIEKTTDDWFFLTAIPQAAWNFASRNNRTIESYREYYVCDQFAGVLAFLKELNDKYTSVKDDTLFRI